MIKTGTGLLDDALISYAEGGMNKVKNNFVGSLEGNVLSLGMIGAGKLGKVTKTLGTVEKVDPIDYKEVASVGTKGAGNASKTVWDNINITQPMYDGTKIPKSFELIASGEKFWVHPNGTKHMVEYITREPMSHGMPINSQTLLSSFQNSVSGAVKQGVKYDEIMNSGNWELIFSKPRADVLFPVIKHAVYRP